MAVAIPIYSRMRYTNRFYSRKYMDIIPLEVSLNHQIRVYILCGIANIIWRIL